jgi:hypothetical protein
VSSGRRHSMKAKNPKGDYQDLVHIDKMVLVVFRREATFKGKLVSNFRQPRGQLNRRIEQAK